MTAKPHPIDLWEARRNVSIQIIIVLMGPRIICGSPFSSSCATLGSLPMVTCAVAIPKRWVSGDGLPFVDSNFIH